MNTRRTYVLFALLLLIGGGILYLVTHGQSIPSQQDTVTEADTHLTWKTLDSEGVTFSYPEDIGMTYISLQEWPPYVQVIDGAFTCAEKDLSNDGTGQTARKTVEDRTYCVTTVVEGAAGSMYTHYVYAFPKERKTVMLAFTLRAVQCGNYNDPKKTECEKERETFDSDELVDQMVRTLSLQGK